MENDFKVNNMQEFESLFSPVKINSLDIANRFVVPPIASKLANKDGTVSQALIDYWVTRARGGWGLLIVEFTAIDPLGKAGPCRPCLWGDEFIEGLRKLTEAVHQYGVKIAIQLNHAGRQTTEGKIGIPGAQPVSASPVPCPLERVIPRELSSDEVYELIQKFSNAAVRARDAGFDAVEIHGAHGYLLAQFMSAYSNKRVDEFGGSLYNRMRFPLEVIRSIRRKLGQSYPLLFRMSGEERVPGGRTLEESRIVAHLVEKAGIDALDISVGVSGSDQYIIAPAAVAPGFLLTSSAEIKKAVSIPVIAVGRINHPLLADDAIKAGKADLIAWGRASLADPELPDKIAAGQLDDIAPCIACIQGCVRRPPSFGRPPSKLGITCLVNPFCGREGEMHFTPAVKPKKVTVVGGGPAGLEAAWISAARGHRVTLYEKQQVPGGQYRIAAIPPFKQDIATAISYYVHMCEKHGVLFKLGTEVDAESIITDKPDTVIIATGGEPVIPDVKGAHGDRVVNASDILEGKKQAGNNVLIVGGGMVGCEMSDFLGEHLHNVTLVEMLPEIAGDVPTATKFFLKQRLKEYGTQIKTGTTVVELLNDGAIVMRGGEKSKLEGFDTIVLAMGTRSVNHLSEKLEKKVPELYVIGDALAPGQAIDAIEEGARTALKL
jgi:2,4-dienoyl-CoA reductase-like NADH-dependent reductase (Old Yellow Enzyme family)/thioredoxin reductase